MLYLLPRKKETKHEVRILWSFGKIPWEILGQLFYFLFQETDRLRVRASDPEGIHLDVIAYYELNAFKETCKDITSPNVAIYVDGEKVGGNLEED